MKNENIKNKNKSFIQDRVLVLNIATGIQPLLSLVNEVVRGYCNCFNRVSPFVCPLSFFGMYSLEDA